MLRKRFNNAWSVQNKGSLFSAFSVEAPKSTAVTLPHDMMISLPRRADVPNGKHKGYFPNGSYEYTKTFFVDETYRNKTVILEFEGVYKNAAVYINGDYAGQRPYGYSNFYIPLSRFLRFGTDNTIKVTVDTGDDSRWYTGAGIYRNVNILTGEPVHFAVDSLKITTADIGDNYAVVEIQSLVENLGLNTATASVLTELIAEDGRVVNSERTPLTLCEQSTPLRRQFFIKNPVLWDVDSPNLYECRQTIFLDGSDSVVDTETCRFGIRRLQLDIEHGLRINGKTVKLRGACIHHDNGVIGAATFERAEERRVELLKAAGFNSIRCAHNPASKALLDACDRLGMLVMDEAFDMWSIGKTNDDYSRYFPEWWERDITAMVDKDYNHPSVILYSIGNEIPETGSGIGSQWGRKIAEKIKSLDSSRLTINSINGMVSVMDKLAAMWPKEDAKNTDVNNAMAGVGAMLKQIMNSELGSKATEESYSCVDVAGYNYMDSRYESDKKLYPNRIICGSETFPAGIAANWKLVEENDQIIGDFTWTGWDYLGEAGLGKINYSGKQTVGIYGAYPWLIAWCGDIDVTGNRKPISYYREIVWGLRKEPYIAVEKPERYGADGVPSTWSWSDTVNSWTWPGYEGKPIKVEVYSDAGEVVLLLNGKTIGKAAAGKQAGFKAVFDTVYAPGTLEAAAYLDGREISRTKLVSAGSPASLRLYCDRTALKIDAGDLAYIMISLIDPAGIINRACEKMIRLTVLGPGVLQGFGSANPESEEDYFSTERTTFNGEVLAVIRPTGEAGEIRVTAEAAGCPPQSVTVMAGSEAR
ncbi:MAG: DUF4982 domain-containing protein [Treponema sp.]|jgi:beta-galactosidase|nr:DUF4982 domain-containing protein [Treponema sp.]